MVDSIWNDKVILIIRWVTRIISLVFAGIFLLFIIGEGNIKEFVTLSTSEIFLVIFVPLLYILGVAVSWKKELIGGIIILVSVIGFNIVEIVAGKHFSLELEFTYLLSY